MDIIVANVPENYEIIVSEEVVNVTAEIESPIHIFVSDAITGGGGFWGSITGNIDDQIDLKDKLDLKSDVGHTHPQTDIDDLVSDQAVQDARLTTNESNIAVLESVQDAQQLQINDNDADIVNIYAQQVIQNDRITDTESVNATQTSDIITLQGLAPTIDQKAGLDASNSPSAGNKYLTAADIVGGLPTGEIPTAYITRVTQVMVNDANFVDVASMTTSINLSASVPIYSICSFESSQSGGGSQVIAELRIVIDGVASPSILVDFANGVNATGSINFRSSARPIGVREVKLQARKVTGAKDFNIDKAFLFAEGLQAPKGEDGVGLLGGGNANTVLKKIDGTDFNTSWSFVDWSELTGIPSTFNPAAHTHTEAQITDLDKYTQSQVNTLLSTKSDNGHTHTFASLTGLPTTIAGYGITDFNSLGDARWSLLSHVHTFASLTSKPTTLSGFGITDAIGGTIANTQIAFGTGTNTVGGSANLTWNGTQLAINGGANNFILRLTSTSVGSYTRYTTSVTDVSVGSSSAGLLDVFDNTSGIRRLIVTTGGMTATTNTASNFITQISSVRNIVSGLDGAGDFALYDNTLSRHYISFVSNNLRLLQAGVGNVLIGTTTDNGAKLQVAGTSTFSGVMTIGRLASDGANLNGNIMYNSTTNKFRAYENGQWVNMIGGGGGGAVDSVFGRTGNVSALVGDYSAFYSQLGHTHTFASLTSIPTTIGGYGITDTTSVLITGFVSGAGIVAATDTILQAIQKLNGNDSLNVKIASNLSDLNNVVTARNNILPSKSGNSLKVLRVNAGETDYELATISGGGGTWGTISGTLSAQTDLQSALDGKENTFSKNTAFNKNFGVIADTVAEGNDSRFHTHTNTTDLARVGVLVNLTDSPTITLDSAAGEVFVVTLGGNRNLAAPSNPVSGRKIIVRFRQDGTGNRTISFNAAYRFSTDVPSPTLTTGANKTDYLGFIYNGIDAVWDCVAVTKGF